MLHGATEVFAFATSATRNAANGQDFVNDIKNLFGVEVKVIQGDEEAELIYYGVRQAVNLNSENVLIIDIGGGSNEIIVGHGEDYCWKRSYDLGISRLLQMFNPSDPITLSEVEKVEDFIEQELADLEEPMKEYSPRMIVGSSGSFDTYRSNITSQKLHISLVGTTKKQRSAIPGMDPMRVDMIVLATIFTHFLVKKFGISRMVQSAYALKEGAVWKMVNLM